MKTNAYLIQYAKAQVGKPYWFGTFGQTASKKLYEEKKKQYPKYYTAKDFADQFGQRVHDCAGLIKGALWSDTPTSTPKYNAKEDYGADGFYKAAKKKGKAATFDKVNGRLVFKGTDSKKNHVGVYADGYVYEAKGHAYGVKKTKYSASSWPYWAQCHLFSDAPETPQDAPEKPATSKDDTKPVSKPEPVKTTIMIVTANSGLNIRKGPGKSYQKIAVMPKGAKFEVQKIVSGWAFGKYGKVSGYASMEYLTRE